MKDEAAALCDAADAFQAACNELHRAQEAIDRGDDGTPRLEDVELIYSEKWRTLRRAIYFMRKAMKS